MYPFLPMKKIKSCFCCLISDRYCCTHNFIAFSFVKIGFISHWISGNDYMFLNLTSSTLQHAYLIRFTIIFFITVFQSELCEIYFLVCRQCALMPSVYLGELLGQMPQPILRTGKMVNPIIPTGHARWIKDVAHKLDLTTSGWCFSMLQTVMIDWLVLQ